jgi:hypothetical protein
MKYLIIILTLLTGCAHNNIHLRAYHKGSETSIGIVYGSEDLTPGKVYGLKWAANHTTTAIDKVLCKEKLEIPGDELEYIILTLESRQEILVCRNRIYPNYNY